MNRLFWFFAVLVFLVASCDGTTVRRTDFGVQGIDVSHHQSRIDWPRVARQDFQFAFVKATEGLEFKDSLFQHNWPDMARAGLIRGAYHFFRPTLDARRQAKNFFSHVPLAGGDLPPVLDVEVLDGTSKVELIVGVKTWLWMAEIHYGVKPILYTNVKFYNKYLAGHFEDYPLWIARYNTRQPRTATGRDWQFWQYGNRGRVAGISGEVDLNVFRGNIIELTQLCLPDTGERDMARQLAGRAGSLAFPDGE